MKSSAGLRTRSDSCLLALRRTFAVAAGVVLFGGTVAWHEPPQDGSDVSTSRNSPNRIFRLDGRYVHNVGRLQLQITNIGETGNQNNPSRTTMRVISLSMNPGATALIVTLRPANSRLRLRVMPIRPALEAE